MRDSIGGTVLFWIVLILLSVFIVFIALIIKYARVYKAKNSIVSFIERNEGVVSKDAIDKALMQYNYSSDGAYKICRYLSDDKTKGGYYTIELYSETTFPVVGDVFPIIITIRGETKNITTGTSIRSTDGLFTGVVSECKSCKIKEACVDKEA